jgi:hypothetical protein
LKDCGDCNSSAVPVCIHEKLRQFMAMKFARISIEKHESVVMIELTEKERTMLSKIEKAQLN